jgi:hypothetical protein
VAAVKRLARQLFPICAGVSLLILATLAMLWVRWHLPASDFEERRIAGWMWKPVAASAVLPIAWLLRAWRCRRDRPRPRGFDVAAPPGRRSQPPLP